MKKNFHVLHFKLNEKSHNKLRKIAKQMNKSISSTINIIFKQLLPFIEKNQISFQDKESHYNLIADPKEKRLSILAYIPEEYYRKLKLIHKDQNVYSIARIIREIIKYFLLSCSKYGIDGFFNRTYGIILNWNHKKELYKKNQKEFMIQLLNKANSSPSLIITYDQNSKPMIYKFP